MNQLTKVLYQEQFKWFSWFLLFVLLFQGALLFLASYFGGTIQQFTLLSFGPSRIFMLVLGIISAYAFLGYYYQLGQTRKRYYRSTLVAAILLAGTMVISVKLFSLIEALVVGNQAFISDRTDGTTIVNNSQSITITIDIFSEGLQFIDSTVLFMLFFVLQLLLYYGVGWFISVGFYRYGWVIGLLFIVLAIGFLGLNQFMWSSSLMDHLPALLLVGTVVLTTIVFYFVYLIVKRTPIKLK
ncbi:hypothetical protein [Shouchella miscanthi]|uniref:DUF4386 domain-containing protein n=1 Tax=Shouchella miscanthi TaxID=2598861 RepID=A0ABU6NKP5_9BACI|nr:hypothetical protein [Shouchella miscanthi]